jgi:hypothetical protein
MDEKVPRHDPECTSPEPQDASENLSPASNYSPSRVEALVSTPHIPLCRIIISLTLLFLNYFLAQYDKFILSYFQDSVISSLNLSLSGYGVLSGYATGIVYALLALPMAFIADYTSARLWVFPLQQSGGLCVPSFRV